MTNIYNSPLFRMTNIYFLKYIVHYWHNVGFFLNNITFSISNIKFNT